jgi:hypothetical protein
MHLIKNPIAQIKHSSYNEREGSEKHAHRQPAFSVVRGPDGAVALTVFSSLYFAVRPSLQKSAYAALEEAARSDQSAIDQAIENANGVSVNITYSQKIREAMQRLNKSGALTHQDLLEIADQLVAVNGTMFPVIQIRLYPESGLMVASGMINGQYSFERDALPGSRRCARRTAPR